MKVFLATSFSDKVDARGAVRPEFRQDVGAILQALRDEGYDVYCAVENEGWRIDNSPPEVGVRRDLEVLDASDVMLALMDNAISAGVQFEIGYCVGRGKPVILAVKQGESPGYYNQGAVGAGWVTLVAYDSAAALVRQAVVALHAPAGPEVV